MLKVRFPPDSDQIADIAEVLRWAHKRTNRLSLAPKRLFSR